jgi:drug/metabolite transporter (DMT)-like permease
MMQGNALPALTSSALWGGADFSGGMAVGASGGDLRAALRVIVLSHASTLCVLLLIVLLRGEGVPHGRLLLWGLAAGLNSAVALTAFYIALARGAMGASAAVSGVLAAAIPAIVSITVEGRPSTLRLAGFLVAVVAIWMIAAGPRDEGASKSTLPLAVVAGVGFGIYFVALRMTNPLGVFMPMILSRVVSLTLCGAMLCVLALRGSSSDGVMNRRAIAWALGAGVLDTSGNGLFVLATRMGRLDVAAVLASLYPAATILLAWWLLKERLARRQVLGMAMAVGAVAMITV